MKHSSVPLLLLLSLLLLCGCGRNAAANPIARPTPVSAPTPISPSPTPVGYHYQVVDTMPQDQNSPPAWACWADDHGCLDPNPWWARWDDKDGSWPIQYRFLAPGLVSEAKFYDAVQLLWRWPEGQFLLREAATPGVRIITGSPTEMPNAYADFATTAAGYRIRFNGAYTKVSTWMVSSLLAHELTHLLEAKQGLRQGRSLADCVAREQAAYQATRRFLQWLSDWEGGLPTQSMITSSLSAEDQRLYRDTIAMLASNPQGLNTQAAVDYRQVCR